MTNRQLDKLLQDTAQFCDVKYQPHLDYIKSTLKIAYYRGVSKGHSDAMKIIRAGKKK